MTLGAAVGQQQRVPLERQRRPGNGARGRRLQRGVGVERLGLRQRKPERAGAAAERRPQRDVLVHGHPQTG